MRWRAQKPRGRHGCPDNKQRVTELNNQITVACVLGTRPDAVKMAPVVREFARFPEQVRPVEITT